MEFSHTKLSTYEECPRKYKHRYINKVYPRKRANYFVLGEAVHKYIEMFYRTKNAKLAARQVERVFGNVPTTLLTREERHTLEVDKNIALGIAQAYPKFYKQDFDEYEQFLTEQHFGWTFPKQTHSNVEEPRKYTGIIDCLMKDFAGDWWILETKTAAPSTLTPDYYNRVHIDSQVMGYMHGAKEVLGHFPKGIVYNVIKKPGIRLKKGETLQAFQQRVYMEYVKFAQSKGYFTRQQLIVSHARLEEWYYEKSILTGNLQGYMTRKDFKYWPMHTGACTTKFGSCEYLPACTARAYNKLLYTKGDKK